MECARCHRRLRFDEPECLVCGGPARDGRPTEVASGAAVATGQVAAPAGWFLAIRGLAAACSLVLGAAVVLSTLTSAADVQRIRLLGRVSAAAPVPPTSPLLQDVNDNDTVMQGLAVVHVLLVLVILVVLLNWVRNAYSNSIRLGSALPLTARGAVGWWFVPFANLVRPKQIVDQLWQSSSSEVAPGNQQSWQAQGRTGLVTLWWGMWLLAGLLGNISARTGGSIEALRSSAILDILSNILEVGAALALLTIVRRITDRQSARLASVAA